jgi:hypothetical protein
MTAAGGASFTTTMRMVHRVHRDTANGWSNTSPSFCAGFTEFAKVMFAVSYLANSGPAVDVYFARLA